MKTSWSREAKKNATNLACGEYMPLYGRIVSMVSDGTTITIFYFAGGNEDDKRSMKVPVNAKVGVWVKVRRRF